MKAISTMRADQIVLTECARLGVDFVTLRHGAKGRPMTRARDQIALSLRKSGFSYPEIAAALGMCSHATAIYAVRRAMEKAGRGRAIQARMQLSGRQGAD